MIDARRRRDRRLSALDGKKPERGRRASDSGVEASARAGTDVEPAEHGEDRDHAGGRGDSCQCRVSLAHDGTLPGSTCVSSGRLTERDAPRCSLGLHPGALGRPPPRPPRIRRACSSSATVSRLRTIFRDGGRSGEACRGADRVRGACSRWRCARGSLESDGHSRGDRQRTLGLRRDAAGSVVAPGECGEPTHVGRDVRRCGTRAGRPPGALHGMAGGRIASTHSTR